MRRGTHYAKKLQRAYGKFRDGGASWETLEPAPPVEQLILAVLSQEASMSQARRALAQIREDMVDYNELRVSTPAEISRSIGKYVPRSVQRAKTLIRLLNAVYYREYALSLDSLSSKGVREAKSYLESLEGISPYVSASVLLWSLGGHAIPVNDPTLVFLKRQGLVNPEASGAEVQAFLERHISAADAKRFCLDLEAFAAAKATVSAGPAKTSGGRGAVRKKTVSKGKSTTRRRTKTKATRKTGRPAGGNGEAAPS